MSEHADHRIDRRQALKRLGAAGAVAWTVPAIQTFNMPKAFAQAQPGSPPPEGCGNVRISKGGGCGLPNFDGGGGGGSCLQTANPNGPSACGSIVSATANDGADWVICIAEGCRFQEVSMSSASHCWNKPGPPTDGDPNHNWSGFTISGQCVTVHRSTFNNPPGQMVTQNISHVDLVICCS
jgi:hypothetical protein